MPYTGLTAKLVIEEKEIGYISNWSVDETCDTIEITKLGAKNKEIYPTFCYWSASAEGTADFTDKSAQYEIRRAMTEGKKVKVKFYLGTDVHESGDETEHYLEGDAYVNSFSVNISAEDKAGVSISLTGDGQLKYIPEPVVNDNADSSDTQNS